MNILEQITKLFPNKSSTSLAFRLKPSEEGINILLLNTEPLHMFIFVQLVKCGKPEKLPPPPFLLARLDQ